MPNLKDLAITSPDIAHLERIADDHAGLKGNRVPRLEVTGVPEGTVELALIMHDPDAPMPHGFTHWVVYGIEPGEKVEITETTGRTAPNSDGKAEYVGPYPPAGHGQHHYYFWVYALNRKVEGEPTREEFLRDYADAVIEQARFVGTYSA